MFSNTSSITTRTEQFAHTFSNFHTVPTLTTFAFFFIGFHPFAHCSATFTTWSLLFVCQALQSINSFFFLFVKYFLLCVLYHIAFVFFDKPLFACMLVNMSKTFKRTPFAVLIKFHKVKNSIVFIGRIVRKQQTGSTFIKWLVPHLHNLV